MIAKRVIRGAGYGPEIPANFYFYGPENNIVQIRSKIMNIEKNLFRNVNRFLKYRLNKNVFKNEKFLLLDQFFRLSAIKRSVIGEKFDWYLKMMSAIIEVSAIKCPLHRGFVMRV